MGVLYNTVMLNQDTKKQMYIARLLERGITETKDGTSIHDLDYYSLRQELAVSDYRVKNIDSPENGWY